MLDEPVHVVAVDCNSVLGETVEARRIENIPLVLQGRDLSHYNATGNATDLDCVEPLASDVKKV